MKTSKLALSGVLLALNMIVLFGATMLPGIELSLFALSSLLTAVMVVKGSPKRAFVFFLASALLGILLLPNKVALMPYLLFFGHYGIIKYFIESVKMPRGRRMNRQPIEILAKLIYFGATFGIGMFFFKEAFAAGISLPDFSAVILTVAASLGFLVYDYVFTLLLRQMDRILKN